MANKLNKDLTNRYVIVGSKFYKGNNIERVFLCKMGFGCKQYTSGRQIYGNFVFDGEKTWISGYDVIRFASPEEIRKAKQKFKNKK